MNRDEFRQAVLVYLISDDSSDKKVRVYVGFVLDHSIHKNLVRKEMFQTICRDDEVEHTVDVMYEQYQKIPDSGQRVVQKYVVNDGNERGPIGEFSYKYREKMLLMNGSLSEGMRDFRIPHPYSVLERV